MQWQFKKTRVLLIYRSVSNTLLTAILSTEVVAEVLHGMHTIFLEERVISFGKIMAQTTSEFKDNARLHCITLKSYRT